MDVYWDACTFLDILIDEGRPNRPGALDVYAAARAGQVGIVTSTATVTEVQYVTGAYWRELVAAGEELTAEQYAEAEPVIAELWTPASPVRRVDVSDAIGRRAAQLSRWATFEHQSKLTPIDAIHIATAEREGVPLHTGDRYRWVGEHLGLDIGPPKWAEPQLFNDQ